MKICLINNLYYPYQRGGAEKVVLASAKQYQKEGHDVFVISSKPKEKREELKKVYYLSSDYSQLSTYSYLKRLLWHYHNLFSLSLSKQIINIIQQEKPDLIITHNLMGLGFQTAKLISKLHIPHYHFLHDIQLLHPSGLMYYKQEKKIDSLPSRLYQFITRKLFSSPDKILSPSQWLLKEHQKRKFFPHSKTEIMSLERYIDIPNLEKKEKKNQIIFIGQIEKHKGIHTLISAFQEIENKELNLIIIGTGTELKTMKKLANNNPKIQFLGWKSEQEFIPLLAESKALIIPSLCYENSPTIIQYAHKLNIPIIASNIGGIPENLNNNDQTFTPQNIKELKEKIKQITEKNY